MSIQRTCRMQGHFHLHGSRKLVSLLRSQTYLDGGSTIEFPTRKFILILISYKQIQLIHDLKGQGFGTQHFYLIINILRRRDKTVQTHLLQLGGHARTATLFFILYQDSGGNIVDRGRQTEVPPCQSDTNNYRNNKPGPVNQIRSEEHTSELQSRFELVCRLLLEKIIE